MQSHDRGSNSQPSNNGYHPQSESIEPKSIQPESAPHFLEELSPPKPPLTLSNIQIEFVNNTQDSIEVLLTSGPVKALVIMHGSSKIDLEMLEKPQILYIPGLEEEHGPTPFELTERTGDNFLHFSLVSDYKGKSCKLNVASPDELLAPAQLCLDWLTMVSDFPIKLSGFSIGGYTAARLAADNPDSVCALSLLSPTFLPPWRSWAVANLYLPLVSTIGSLGSVPMLSKESLTNLKEILNPERHYQIFSKISSPIQISVGEREPFSTKYLTKLLDSSPAEQKELITIKHAGHSPFQDQRISALCTFFDQF